MTKYTHLSKSPTRQVQGECRVKKMPECEARRRALSDPDNPPTSPGDQHKFQRVNP